MSQAESGAMRAWKNPRSVVLAILGLAFVIYVANAWTPSSYALGLRYFEAPDDGLVAGKPRWERMDEWAVITPLTQATVNNGFERYNRTSLYAEDLRTTYSLPIFDWGLAFKPTMWTYLVAPPAIAFSFHHAAIILLFVVGYWRLFEKLGLQWVLALLFSLTLFFTGFVQYWWSTLGPPLAFFPWVLLALMSRHHPAIRAVLFFWVAGCWLLSFFYPPIFIQQAFLTLVLLLAFKREELRIARLAPVAISAIAAAGVSLLYLRDWLQATLHTAYPGGRRVGGGDFGLERAVEHLFPTAYLHGHSALVTWTNICELSVISSFYVLIGLCFIDLGSWRQKLHGEALRRSMIVGGALLLVCAWLFLPVPSWAGAPLLWNLVPPVRMAFAAGVLLLLLVLTLGSALGWRMSWPRVAAFAAVVVGGWAVLKLHAHGLSIPRAWRDVAIIVPVVALFVASRVRALSQHAMHVGLLGSAVAVAALTFGNFNPLQSAWPIFDRPRTPVTERLDALAATHPDGTLVAENYPGALLNGWGYASASHVLTSPQLDRFRTLFPQMGHDVFDQTFNRYAHIIVRDVPEPQLLQADAVAVPRRAYLRELPATATPTP